MKKIIEYNFPETTTELSSYDSTKINLGSLFCKYTGVTREENYVGPARIGIGRPMEATTPVSLGYPFVYKYNANIYWVFLAEISTAASTRRIIYYEYNKLTSDLVWKGFITLTFPTVSNHTIRGMRMSIKNDITGTVGVSSTTVTGVGTLFLTNNICVGSRIGFGSTDPTQITTWFQVSAVGSNTSITLTASAGSISTGTTYVVSDVKCIVTSSNATAINGGLFLTKGLRIEDFSTNGTVIPAATTVDNIKAVYWLADAATVLNTASAGVAIETNNSFTDERVYVLDTTNRIYVYNTRATLSGLAAGKSVSGFLYRTGVQGITGTMSVANNGRIGTLNHGVASGVTSLYFVTTTRIYRSDLSVIINGSTTWQSDVMLEIPPGGVATYPATAALSSIEISDNIDRLAIMTTGTAGARSYITQYNTTSTPLDHIFLVDDKQSDQSSADANGVVHPSIQASTFSVWIEDGIAFLCRNTTSILTNHIYTLPIGAHWTFATSANEFLLTSSISTTDAYKFYNLYVNEIKKLGGSTFSLPPEPYRVYYRTAGISSNSGSWTLLDDTGDLSSITPSSEIQFRFEFKILGGYCIPARILGIGISYEDINTDSHYEPSTDKSSITGNTVAYRQRILWGVPIPNMRIRLYNATTGSLVLDDNVISSSLGTWQYSTNGVTWNAWSSVADVVGYYIRYVATSLPASVQIRSLLSQA